MGINAAINKIALKTKNIGIAWITPFSFAILTIRYATKTAPAKAINRNAIIATTKIASISPQIAEKIPYAKTRSKTITISTIPLELGFIHHTPYLAFLYNNHHNNLGSDLYFCCNISCCVVLFVVFVHPYNFLSINYNHHNLYRYIYGSFFALFLAVYVQR